MGDLAETGNAIVDCTLGDPVPAPHKRGGLVSPRAVPRFHRDRRHPSSPGRGGDRTCDDHGEAPYPRHDRGTKTCSARRDREGRREGDRWLVDSRARSFPGLRGISWRLGHYWATDDPQEDDSDPRESLQNMDSLLQAGRIPGFRLLSRRQRIWRGLGPLAQQRERQHPGDLAALAIGRGAGGVRRGIVLGVVLGEDSRRARFFRGGARTETRPLHFSPRLTIRKKGSRLVPMGAVLKR